MEYLPQTIWRQSDRERAKAMIQAIDKQLKSRRIMRSLERFVGGRPYGPIERYAQPPYHSSPPQQTLFNFSQRLHAILSAFHSELVDIEKVAVCSSLRSLKSKHIESHQKRSSINLT
ncbi:hypothetical protein Tco_1360360 [Tanacetum coccineum]